MSGLTRNKDHKITLEEGGGLIGLIVDFATGAGYKLKPSNVEVGMASGQVKEFDCQRA